MLDRSHRGLERRRSPRSKILDRSRRTSGLTCWTALTAIFDRRRAPPRSKILDRCQADARSSMLDR